MYQALYRKWRPKTFDDVVGQPHITETLKRQMETDRVSHAYLFVGTRGTGKTSCAKILAKAVNCLEPSGGNPCNSCFSCVGIDGGSILDVEELDAASNNGVDHVRALRDEAAFTPVAVKKRVYIVDEVHMLSMAAFNALLKILEEPPAHIVFILATTESHKVPATILSRCQRHAFRRVGANDIAGLLQTVSSAEGINLEPNAADMLARLADGSVRDGLALLDQCAGSETIDTDTVLRIVGLAGAIETVNLLKAIGDGDVQAALKIIDTLYFAGKDMGALLDELGILIRDVLLTRVAPRGAFDLLSGSFDDETIKDLSKLAPEMLLFALKELNTAGTDMGRSTNRRLVAELCIIRLCRSERAGDLDALQARISGIEQILAGERAARPSETILPEAEDLPPWEEESAAPPMAQKEEPTPVSAAEPVLSQDGADGLWQKILARVQGEMDMSVYTLINDDKEVQAVLEGKALNLYIENPFIRAMAEEKQVQALIQSAAADIMEEAVPVLIKASSAPVKTETQKLDELESKFSNITFK